jgi:ubiquinone/menaquinone biosynthesis C-methylase UbiE
MSQKPDLSYFGAQSSWGITKHMGGLRATDELAGLCHFGPDSYVLVVGCGIGTTPCHVAKKHGCRVMGIDLSEKMVEWANRRARGNNLQDKVECRVADAQALPFDEGTFDAVISESVNAFVPDKPKAMSECARVTRPGGAVGFNECAWLESPPQTLLDYTYRAMDNAVFLPPDGWRDLLTGAQLKDVVMRTYRVNALRQWSDEVSQMEMRDMAERMKAAWRFLVMSITDPRGRQYVKGMVPSVAVVKNLFKCLGYVICVGRK